MGFKSGKRGALSILFVFTLLLSSSFLVNQGSGYLRSGENNEIPDDVETRRLVYSGSQISDLQMSMDGNGRLDLAWVDNRDGNPEIYFLKAEANGWKLHDDMRLSTSVTDSIMPSLCPTMGHTTTLVWVEQIGNLSCTIRTTTLKYDGGDIILVAQPRDVASEIHLSGRPVLKPSPDGNAFVMWSEITGENRSRLLMARIEPYTSESPQMNVIFESLGLVTSWDFEPRSENDFIATWNGQYLPDGSTDPNYGVFYSSFDYEGKVEVEPLRKSITSRDTRPDIEFHGENISVVFSTRRYAYLDVMITTFGSDGTDLVDDYPVSDLETNNKDPSMIVGNDGIASLLWFRYDDFTWSLAHLDLGPGYGKGGNGKIELMAKNVIDIEHPSSQIITDEGDLFVSYISAGMDGGIYLAFRTRPDLEVSDVFIEDEGTEPIIGENITVSAEIQNFWNSNISGVVVTFEVSKDDTVMKDHEMLTYCQFGLDNIRNFTFAVEEEGIYNVAVRVDPEDLLPEKNESNNMKSLEFRVGRQDVILSVSSSGILPGGSGKMIASLENKGTVAVTYNLEIEGDSIGWFLVTGGSLTVGPGSSSILEFDFSPSPQTLAGKYMMLVRGESEREKRDPVLESHHLNILPFYNSSVDFGNYEREIDPGIPVTIPVDLHNHGNSWTRFSIEGTNSMDLPLSYNGNPLPQVLPTIQAGQSLNLLLSMDIPFDLLPGQTIEVDISLKNQEAGQTYTSTYNMTVREMPQPQISIDEDDILLGNDWSPRILDIQVVNTGNVRDMFEFSVKAQTGDWDAIILEPYSGEAPLSPGEEMNVSISIVPPPIPMIGSKIFTFKAVPSLRTDKGSDLIFDVQVEGKYNVSFTQKRLELDTESGIKHRLMLTYTNTGNQDGQFSLMFSGAGSEGLYVEPMTGGRILWNESKPIQIASGATNSFWIEVTVPDSDDNKLVVNVTCLEDTSVTDEIEIVFKTPQDTLMKNLLLGSLVALVIATAGIVAVVSKFLMKKRTKASVDLLEEELD
jgi:uncharacterized membrane protein